jgi:oligosaccharyltransferase complex subunit beta
MKWLISFIFLGLLSAVQALSSSGNNLLVILEELADKTKYSKYFADLEGMSGHMICLVCVLALTCGRLGRGFKITYESPKSENVELFHLGERAHDHLLILPIKLKGNIIADVLHVQANLKQALDPVSRPRSFLISLMPVEIYC